MGEMTSAILEVKALRKLFDGHAAVDGVDFALAGGELVGLLGPNGAGKTTFIKTAIGLMRPTAGDIRYYGRSFADHAQEVKRLIGVVPQQSNVDRDLTAYENLYLHAILHGIPESVRRLKIEEALYFAGLSSHMHEQVKKFSGGMLRRLVIVRALLHDPEILFLDEPTVGLDPQIRRSLWELIIKVNQVKKTAVLLTTHYIEEAEKLCGRVVIINGGRIIAAGRPEALKQELGRYVLEIFHDDRIEEIFFAERQAALERIGLCTATCKVREVSLEDVFLKLTGRRINV